MNDVQRERPRETVSSICPRPTNDDPLLDAASAGQYLGLVGVVKHPGQAVRALCRKKRLQSTVVAGKIMIRQSWLEQYIRGNMR